MQVVSNLPNGIVHILDENFRYVFNAGKELQKVGLSNEQLVGKSIYDVFPAEKAKRIEERYREVLQGRAVSFEGEYKNHTFIVNAVPLDCPSGKSKQILALSTNITARKRAEEEKERLQEQLFHSQKLEALGKLAGGIAHDFNNMLNVIVGNAQLGLNFLNPDAAGHEEFQEILKASERAKALSMKMLAFARREKLNERPLSVNNVVGELAEMLKRSLDKKIRVETFLAEHLPPLHADEGQINQALLNLCTNAQDAMPEGGNLTIETGLAELNEAYCENHAGVEPGKYCCIKVGDTGVGMPKEMLDKIFDPFFTTKDISTGSGLGLSVTLGIVQSHGGHIRVQSEAGRGTAFRLYLPYCEKAEAMRERPPSRKIDSKSKTILIVDDEPLVLSASERFLKYLGFNTLCAEGGAKAVDVYKKHRGKIDLVLLDMMMPDMKGDEAFRALRKIDPDANVVICSGYSIEGKVSELKAEGLKGFLQKPYNIEQLRSLLNESLETSR